MSVGVNGSVIMFSLCLPTGFRKWGCEFGMRNVLNRSAKGNLRQWGINNKTFPWLIWMVHKSTSSLHIIMRMLPDVDIFRIYHWKPKGKLGERKWAFLLERYSERHSFFPQKRRELEGIFAHSLAQTDSRLVLFAHGLTPFAFWMAQLLFMLAKNFSQFNSNKM